MLLLIGWAEEDRFSLYVVSLVLVHMYIVYVGYVKTHGM